MFESIDEVPWAELRHAYGSASDVPDMLDNLASHHDGTREQALYEAYGNIYHQGDRYEATPYAVPFLLEILREPGYPGRGQILDLLTFLVIGFDSGFIPQGFAGEIKRYRHAAEVLKDASDRQSDLDYYNLLIEITEAVSEGVDDFVAILDEADPAAAVAATRLLAFLPESSPRFAPALLKAATRADDVAVRGNALIALALASSPDHELSAEPFTTALASEVFFLRAAGAFGLAILGDKSPPEVVDVLLAVIDKGGELGELFPWQNGEAAAVATRCLAHLCRDEPDRILDALEKRLGAMSTFQAGSIVAAVMALLIPEPIDFTSPEPLTGPQRRWLTLLSRVPTPWEIGGSEYGNFTSLMHSYHLPRSRQELAKLLESC